MLVYFFESLYGTIIVNPPGSLLVSLVDMSPVEFLVNWDDSLLGIFHLSIPGIPIGLRFVSQANMCF